MHYPQESGHGPDALSPSVPVSHENQKRLDAIDMRTRELGALAQESQAQMETMFGTNAVSVRTKDLDLSHTPLLFRQFIQTTDTTSQDGDLVIGIEDKVIWRTVRLIHKSPSIFYGWTIDINIPLESYECGPRIQVKYYEHPALRTSGSKQAEEAIQELNAETSDLPLREERLALADGLFSLADQVFEVAIRNQTRNIVKTKS
jgi:hypothetical protein